MLLWASLKQLWVKRVAVASISMSPYQLLGRIVNRFAKCIPSELLISYSIDALDNLVSDSLRMLSLTAYSIVGATILVSVILPWFLSVNFLHCFTISLLPSSIMRAQETSRHAFHMIYIHESSFDYRGSVCIQLNIRSLSNIDQSQMLSYVALCMLTSLSHCRDWRRFLHTEKRIGARKKISNTLTLKIGELQWALYESL